MPDGIRVLYRGDEADLLHRGKILPERNRGLSADTPDSAPAAPGIQARADHDAIISDCPMPDMNGAGIAADTRVRFFGRRFGRNSGPGIFPAWEILSLTGISFSENGVPGQGARFERIVPKGMWRRMGEN